MIKYCADCGAELRANGKFCSKCGNKIINDLKPVQQIAGESNEGNDTFLDKPITNKNNNNYDSFEYSENHSGASTGNIYQDGMDIIISSSVLYSAPFFLAGKQIIEQFQALKSKTADSLFAEQINNIHLEKFLSDFYKYSNTFVERVCLYFSDVIRKQTLRSDIKGKTTESISDEIRKESFKKFDEVFLKYTVTMQELGVQLESVSSIKSAVQGTLLGGGLQLMGSKGKSSGAGMVAGALIGAALAEAEKLQIRERLLRTAFNGIKETIDTLPTCNQKLMDQYSSYIFGSIIDFNERDKQVERGRMILNDIRKHCSIILDNIINGNAFWTESILKIKKAQKGINFWKVYGVGFLFFAIITAGMDSESGSALGGFLMLFGPVIVYAIYALVYRQKQILKQKEKIITDINSKRTLYKQLEDSLNVLSEYKNPVRFNF